MLENGHGEAAKSSLGPQFNQAHENMRLPGQAIWGQGSEFMGNMGTGGGGMWGRRARV